MRAVVPSLDGPVLRVLAGTTRPLTGREVARLAGSGSEAGVRKVLQRLVQHGLVQVTEAGPASLYVANRAHLAWSAVETLVHLPDRFRERLTSLLATWNPAPVLAGLFGSAARGDGSTDSDIDLLLVRPDEVPDPLGEEGGGSAAGSWAEQVDNLRLAVESWTGNAAQVYEIPLAEFVQTMRSGDPLVESWRRDLVVLAGPSAWNRAPWLSEHPKREASGASADGAAR